MLIRCVVGATSVGLLSVSMLAVIYISISLETDKYREYSATNSFRYTYNSNGTHHDFLRFPEDKEEMKRLFNMGYYATAILVNDNGDFCEYPGVPYDKIQQGISPMLMDKGNSVSFIDEDQYVYRCIVDLSRTWRIISLVVCCVIIVINSIFLWMYYKVNKVDKVKEWNQI